MTGVVEVQLPMDYKIKNIEETEAAKKQMLGAGRLGAFRCFSLPSSLPLLQRSSPLVAQLVSVHC